MNETKSIPHSPTLDSTTVNKPTITVKEAAERLGIPKWRIYRMDRVNAPYKFVPSGRRILIDAHSFALYLGASRGHHSKEGPGDSPQNPTHTPQEDVVVETSVREKRPESLVEKPNTGSGQREVIMPRRSASFPICTFVGFVIA